MLLPEQVGTMSPAGVADVYAWPQSSRPWVRAVTVSTADGATRSARGRSAGISTAADRLVFTTIRGLADVILVGAEAIRAEEYGPIKAQPSLAKRRRAAGQSEVARLAIATTTGDLDPSAAVFTEAAEPPLLLVPSSLPEDRRTALGAVADIVECGDDVVDLAQAIDALAGLGLRRVACEGGPHLVGQLAAAGLLDDLCLTVTPLLSGGTYEGQPVPRILDGASLPDTPRSLQLHLVLESSGTLFLRYTAAPDNDV